MILTHGANSLGETGHNVIGGKTYEVVTMPDGKKWLAENLDFTFPGLDVGSAGLSSTPKANYYDDDEHTNGWNGRKCGLLYNWHAVKYLNDNRNRFFRGWRIPTLSDYNTLILAIGGTTYGGKELKQDNVSWAPNWNGTNDYDFNLLPAGRYNGNFVQISSRALIWTATEYDSINAYFADVDESTPIGTDSYRKDYQYSIRLIEE